MTDVIYAESEFIMIGQLLISKISMLRKYVTRECAICFNRGTQNVCEWLTVNTVYVVDKIYTKSISITFTLWNVL